MSGIEKLFFGFGWGKGKGHSLQAKRRGGVIALNDSQLGTRRLVSTTPRLLYPGNDHVPIVQEAGWDSGTVWVGLENLAPQRGSSPGPSSR